MMTIDEIRKELQSLGRGQRPAKRRRFLESLLDLHYEVTAGTAATVEPPKVTINRTVQEEPKQNDDPPIYSKPVESPNFYNPLGFFGRRSRELMKACRPSEDSIEGELLRREHRRRPAPVFTPSVRRRE